jgi:hypothetical protein
VYVYILMPLPFHLAIRPKDQTDDLHLYIKGGTPRKNGSYPKGHRFTQLCAIVKNFLGVQRELGIYTQSRECMGLELAERSAGSHPLRMNNAKTVEKLGCHRQYLG